MSESITSVSFRIDSKLKQEADDLFQKLGLNMTTAFNIFLRQSVREGGLPFMVTTLTPNSETIAAIKEARSLVNDKETKKYTPEELFGDLDK